VRRLIIIAGAIALLAAPAPAAAGGPSKADRREAQKECRAERGTTDATREAFKAEYRNFGACVSEKAREAKAERKKAKTKAERAKQDAKDAEQAEERKNAAEECDEERGETQESRKAFEEKYGTNHNKRNAFGKCVSQKAQEQDDA
jgi:hypothetical protein